MNTGNVAMPQGGTPVMQAQGGAAAGQVAMGGDAFAQLLTQLLQNGEEMAQLFASMQGMEEDEQSQGTDLAAMMMAELFGSAPISSDLLQLMEDQGQQQTDLAANMVAAGENVQAVGTVQPALFAANDAQKAGQQVQTPAAQQMAQEALPTQSFSVKRGKAELPIEEAAQTTAAQGGEVGKSKLEGDTQFLSSISEAKKALEDSNQDAGEPKKQEPAPLDLDQLQRDVNTGKFSAVGKKHDFAESLQSHEILNQVKTGLTHNLSQGKNEFVVKLKPDGLGEITVKMVEEGGKIALNIVTSNAQVAKMLNSGLVELRETLRPFNAEVHEVVEQQSYAQSESYQQNLGSQQNQQFEHQGQAASHPFQRGDDMELSELLAQEPLGADLASALDTYI